MNILQVLTLGSATVDIFFTYNMITSHHFLDDLHQNFLLLAEGSKIEISHLSYSAGGGAINTAATFKKLGASVQICAKIGSDEGAQKIKRFLEQLHIDTTALVASPTIPTGTSFIIPTTTGNRVIFAYRGANSELGEADISPTLFQKVHDVLYISSLAGTAQKMLPNITATARKTTRFIACNPGISQLSDDITDICLALKNIDIFILNAQEAQRFFATLCTTEERCKESYASDTDPDLLQKFCVIDDKNYSIAAYFKEILSRGPSTVVVTNGEEGVYVGTQDGIIFHKAIPAKTVSTVGAGDAFGSCFVASRAYGESLEDAMVKGIINSASVLSHLNAHDGLLTREEIENRFKNIKKEIHFFSYNS